MAPLPHHPARRPPWHPSGLTPAPPPAPPTRPPASVRPRRSFQRPLNELRPLRPRVVLKGGPRHQHGVHQVPQRHDDPGLRRDVLQRCGATRARARLRRRPARAGACALDKASGRARGVRRRAWCCGRLSAAGSGGTKRGALGQGMTASSPYLQAARAQSYHASNLLYTPWRKPGLLASLPPALRPKQPTIPPLLSPPAPLYPHPPPRR